VARRRYVVLLSRRRKRAYSVYQGKHINANRTCRQAAPAAAGALPTFSKMPDIMNQIATLNGLRNLWAETTGSPDICIAVLDGPVDVAHACFAGAQVEMLETHKPIDADDALAMQHGTHVASIIFGQHGSEVQGVAPGCRGVLIPIYGSGKDANRICSQLDLARAINLAVSVGAHIINISGGELSASGVADPLLTKAIALCAEHDILVVAAAGNDGCRCLHVPASMASVLAVGAMDLQGAPLEFSNWGDLYLDKGILALGADVAGAAAGGGVAVRSGTSYAAPIVTGVAALLMSLQLERGASPHGQAVHTLLLDAADACDSTASDSCARVLAGRLNIHAAHAGLVHQQPSRIAASTYSPPGVDVGSHSRMPHTYMKSSANLDCPPPSHWRSMMNDHDTLSQLIPSETATLPMNDAGVAPSDCGCNKKKADPLPVYALGQIGIDFGSASKRDAFAQLSGINVDDYLALLDYLDSDPASAFSLIWTLSMDATVVYAINPYGPFASSTYERLRQFLRAQLQDGVERVSVPGLLSGTVKLMNGQEVPGLFPDLRGMYGWSVPDLVSACLGAPSDANDANSSYQARAEGVRNFLERVYYEVRNLGITPQDRAMNYAATNAFQASEVYDKAIQAETKLDSIAVERSPICRPGSDCWDVKLSFFNPAKRLEQARHVYRFTIDVSEVIPVTVGKVRHWDVY
jgi:cyanobactin maturation PatA/PatG family protease